MKTNYYLTPDQLLAMIAAGYTVAGGLYEACPMTEQQWLTSTNPAEMHEFVKDRITERQHRFFVEACQSLCEIPLANIGMNGWSLRADLLREIIGNPFRRFSFHRDPRRHLKPGTTYGVGQMFQYDPPDVYLDPAWLTWNNNTVTNLVHAMMYEDRGPYLNRYLLRDEPQWAMMGIIADALEEAGCTEKAILDHLRGTEPCYCMNYEWRSQYECKVCSNVPDESGCIEHGKGCYVVNEDGGGMTSGEFDCGCNGTGKRPVQHVKGCWVVELLIAGWSREEK